MYFNDNWYTFPRTHYGMMQLVFSGSEGVRDVHFDDRYEYHWCDGVNYKKPTALPAPQYIALLMEWVESQINDESLFPVQIGQCYLQ